MRRFSILQRFRLILAMLLFLPSLAIPSGASAQTTNFTLTWVYFYCAAYSFDFEWSSSGPVSRVTFEFYDEAAGPVTETHVEEISFSSPYIHDLVGSFSPDVVVVTAEMATVPVEVFRYTVVMPGPAFCGHGDVGGDISGGFVAPPPPPPPDVTISIHNVTCTGFDWSVDATANVVTYVSVIDSTSQNMIPVIPREGASRSGSESIVVENETQTNFTIYVTVVEEVTEAQLDSDFVEMDCPLPTDPEPPDPPDPEPPDPPDPEPPDPSVTVTPDPISTVTPDPLGTEPPTSTVTVTPDATRTETPDPSVPDTPGVTPVDTPASGGSEEGDNLLIIQIEMPNGESIEGAPYSLFAPEAAQISGGRYRQGTVGANNIVREAALIEGQYRLLVEPPGFAAIDFSFSVAAQPVTELLAVVSADGTVTVTNRQTSQPPPAEAPPVAVPTDGVVAESPTESGASAGTGGAVTGLPSTGSGEAPVITPLMAFALATAMVGLLSLAGIRRTGSSR